MEEIEKNPDRTFGPEYVPPHMADLYNSLTTLVDVLPPELFEVERDLEDRITTAFSHDTHASTGYPDEPHLNIDMSDDSITILELSIWDKRHEAVATETFAIRTDGISVEERRMYPLSAAYSLGRSLNGIIKNAVQISPAYKDKLAEAIQAAEQTLTEMRDSEIGESRELTPKEIEELTARLQALTEQYEWKRTQSSQEDPQDTF